MPSHDDDPTHALDGFAQRLRDATPAAAPSTDLDDLLAPLASAAPAPEARRRARSGTLRNGMAWREDDIVDVTDIDLPPPAAERPADLAAIGQVLQAASAQVAADWATEALSALEPVWQPDGQTLQLRPQRNPRVLDTWLPGAWIGATRQVLDASTELVQTSSGPVVETHPPLRLLLLWAPPRVDAPVPVRWPDQARLAPVPADAVGDALLALLPPDARLWLDRAGDDIDWALGAEIVLHHDTALRPAQAEALRGVITSTREAAFARLNDRYRLRLPDGAAVRQ